MHRVKPYLYNWTLIESTYIYWIREQEHLFSIFEMNRVLQQEQ